MPLSTLNEAVFIDYVNDYFQSNWRSLVVLLSRSDIPLDQQIALIQTVSEFEGKLPLRAKLILQIQQGLTELYVTNEQIKERT
jgi:hypothetical protein